MGWLACWGPASSSVWQIAMISAARVSSACSTKPFFSYQAFRKDRLPVLHQRLMISERYD